MESENQLFADEFRSDEIYDNFTQDNNVDVQLVENSMKTVELSDEAKRLKDIINNEHMTISQFAQAINVRISTLSHIVNGRNNPSLDIMQRTLRRFTYLSSDWLILGKGDSPFENNIHSPEIEIVNNHPSMVPVVQEDDSFVSSESSESESNIAHETQQKIDVDEIVSRVIDALEPRISALQASMQTSSQSILNNGNHVDTDVKDDMCDKNMIDLRSNQSGVGVTKIIVFYSDNTFEQFTK